MSGINWRLFAISFVLALTAIFQMGYTNAYPNTAINGFRQFMNESHHEPMKMSNIEFEWIWSAMLAIYFIGFAAGSLISAKMADIIGRKWTLFIGTLGSLTSAFVALFSIILKLRIIFGVSRLLMSLSAAISMNSLILLFQESSPNNMKGLISFNAEMSFVITNLIGGLFGMKFLFGNNLVGLVGISIVPSAIACFLTFFLHESPKYLYLKKDDDKEAAKSLKFYQNISDESVEAKFLSELKIEKNEMNSSRSLTIFEIFACQPHRRGFLLGLITMQLTVPIWPIIFFSTDFLLDVGFSYSLAEKISTVMLFVSTLSTVFGMFAVKKFSRKWLLVVTAIFNVISILGFAVSAIGSKFAPIISYGCIAFLILNGVSYSIALGPIAWFISSELAPITCRATIQSLCLGANHFFALILAFLTFPLYKTIGPIILIIFFVIPGGVFIMLLIIYLPETKDRHINDIQNDLKTKQTQKQEQNYALNGNDIPSLKENEEEEEEEDDKNDTLKIDR